MVFVSNWKEVLKKSAVVWVGVLGAWLPELPDLVLRWLDSGQSAVLAPETKNWLRVFLLTAAVPIARIWQQHSFNDSKNPSPSPPPEGRSP